MASGCKAYFLFIESLAAQDIVLSTSMFYANISTALTGSDTFSVSITSAKTTLHISRVHILSYLNSSFLSIVYFYFNLFINYAFGLPTSKL
jgi:hypothetical protein